MKAIRKMVNGNKGFFSLWLILLFLNAGLSRNFIFSLPSAQKAVSSHHNDALPKHLLSAIDESAGSFIDQFKKDSDSDDIEFIFFGNFSPKAIIPHFIKHEFAEFAPFHTIYKVPLYDLFCNWKFHLS